jgi:3-dehydroquinate synthetase
VVTLGGGATSDAAGFAAATYLRGVPHVPVPSSLLAMVDAAIGGKTGVNLDAGKNLVGAFHFPALVLVDSGLLATLPGPELVAGLAEVLKAGLIGDPELVSLLDRQGGAIAAGDADWPELIARSVSVKAQIVAEDPWELGRREHLNLGHTFAHALEAASDYALAHGPAVGIGLLAAARLGRDLGLTEDHLPERVERILRRLGLPVGYPGSAPVRVLAAMGVDKKRRGGRLRFVLPKAVGDVTVVDDVPESAVLGILDTILRPQQP